ncbi:MAG: YraN family protein [Bacteroidota bacterium]
MSTKEIGNSGERNAVSFLQHQGFVILERNYRSNHGEIDVVAMDGDNLVFVEVKFRHGTRFGSPEEAVTPAKQGLIRRTAEGYVQEKNLSNIPCRFDVVAITAEKGMKKFVHYKNAF